MDNVSIVILAAGKGTRMGQSVPKVLVPVFGRPMIEWVLDEVMRSGLVTVPVVVVGHEATQVRLQLGRRCRYVTQTDQLGTGHAVAVCKKLLKNKAHQVVVVYGDHPTIDQSVIVDLVDKQNKTGAVIAMSTVVVPNFRGKRSVFLRYGHLVRDAKGKKILRCVEYKDASPKEKAIKEVNSGYYCFDSKWLWENVDKIQKRNVKNEYYLTDLIGMAVAQGEKVTPVPMTDWRYGLGSNTPSELRVAETLLRDRV